MLEDKLWKEILARIEVGQIVDNFKGKADSKVISIENDRINFEVQSNGNETYISKTTFLNILNNLMKKGAIRQAEAGNNPRISLGILMLLPYFTSERRNGTKYLVWTPTGKEEFLSCKESKCRNGI